MCEHQEVKAHYVCLRALKKKRHLFVLVYCKHPNKSKGTCAESVKVQPVTCWIGVGVGVAAGVSLKAATPPCYLTQLIDISG